MTIGNKAIYNMNNMENVRNKAIHIFSELAGKTVGIYRISSDCEDSEYICGMTRLGCVIDKKRIVLVDAVNHTDQNKGRFFVEFSQLKDVDGMDGEYVINLHNNEIYAIIMY